MGENFHQAQLPLYCRNIHEIYCHQYSKGPHIKTIYFLVVKLSNCMVYVVSTTPQYYSHYCPTQSLTVFSHRSYNVGVSWMKEVRSKLTSIFFSKNVIRIIANDIFDAVYVYNVHAHNYRMSYNSNNCWLLPSNQSFYRQIAGYRRGKRRIVQC